MTDLIFSIAATDDIVVEGDEDFTVSIGSPTSTTGASVVGTGSVTTTITDTDTAEVSIAATTDAEEPATDGRFTVTLSAPSATATVVSYTVTGSATAGDDYTTLSGLVTIPAGQTTAFIDVSVLDDGFVEGVEDIIVTLDTVTSGDFGGRITVAAAPDNTATINLASEDAPGLVVEQGGTTVDVTEGGTTQIRVRLAAIPTGPVQITVTPSSPELDLGAGAGNPVTLTFVPGNALVFQTITVRVADDSVVNADRNATVTFSSTSAAFGFNGLTASPVTIRILNDDTSGGSLPDLFGPLANSFRDLGQTDSLFAGLASFDTVNGFGDRYPGVGFGLYQGGPLGTGGGAGLVPVFSGLGAFGWGVQVVVYDRLGFPITSVNATIGESGSWLMALPGVNLSDAVYVEVSITPPYTGYESVQPTVFGADITGLFGSWMNLFETGQLSAEEDDILGQLLGSVTLP
jgi:hypothetical protein